MKLCSMLDGEGEAQDEPPPDDKSAKTYPRVLCKSTWRNYGPDGVTEYAKGRAMIGKFEMGQIVPRPAHRRMNRLLAHLK
jgi:hypothetical protein